MKTTFRFFQCATIISLLVLGMTSCGSGPKYAEEEEIKSFILWNCIDQNYVESLCDLWIEEVNNGNIEIEYYEIPEYTDSDVLTLSQECYCLFRYRMGIENFKHHNIQSYNFDLGEDYEKFMENFDINFSDCSKDQINKEQERAQLIVNALYFSFYEYFKKYADEHIRMLSWEVDIMNTGDLFSGYTITYEVDSNFYALVTLIEYDSEGRYEYRIENKSNSLIELNQ